MKSHEQDDLTQHEGTSDTNQQDVRWAVLAAITLLFLPVALAWFVPKLVAAHSWFWRRGSVVAVFALAVILVSWLGVVIGQAWWRASGTNASLLAEGLFWLVTGWGVVFPITITVWFWRRSTIANEVHDRTFDARRIDAVQKAMWKAVEKNTSTKKATRRPITRDQADHPRAISAVVMDDDNRTTWRKLANGSCRRVSRRIVMNLPVPIRWEKYRECQEWEVGQHLCPPEKVQSFALLGGTGCGKTVFALDIGFAHVRQGGSFVYINAKGDKSLAPILKKVAETMGIPFHHWTVDGKAPFDAWQGTNDEIITKILALLGTPESDASLYYRRRTKRVLTTAAAKREAAGLGPWASPSDVLGDLVDWIDLDVKKDELERARADILDAFEGLEQALSRGEHPDAWTWEDTERPGIYLVDLPPSSDNAKAAGVLILADLVAYAATRRPNFAVPLLVVIDEAQVLLTNTVVPPVDLLMEQLRSSNIGLGVCTQSTNGLGANGMEDRILDSGVPIFTGRLRSPEPVSNRAGTRTRGETGHQKHDDLATGTTTERPQDSYVIDPQRVRHLEVGCFVLSVAGREPVWVRALPPESWNSPHRAIRPISPPDCYEN